MSDEDLRNQRVNWAVGDYMLRHARNEGRMEGAEAKKNKFIHNLLVETDLEVAKIAMMAKVSVRYVEDILDELKKDQEEYEERD